MYYASVWSTECKSGVHLPMNMHIPSLFLACAHPTQLQLACRATVKAAMVVRAKHFIDMHKFFTGPAVLAMMAKKGVWRSTPAWIYLALHGTYGLLWLLKSRIFPDKQWERPIPVWEGVFIIWGALSLYWVAPWIIVTRGVAPSPWYQAACVALYSLGVFLHFSADMQKHTHMKLSPGNLLSDGLWSRCRNPNYLGELCIYLGFTMMAQHWLPLTALAVMVVGYWVPNMRKKDASLSRHEGFKAWKERSAMFIPGVL